MRASLLYQEGITLVVSKNHPLSIKEKIQLSDLSDENLVMFEGTNIDGFKNHLAKANVKVNSIKKVPEILLIYKYASNQNVVGISVKSLKNKIIFHDVVEIPFDQEEILLNFEFMYTKNNANTQLLKNYLLKYIQE